MLLWEILNFYSLCLFRSIQHGDSGERFENGGRCQYDHCHVICYHGYEGLLFPNGQIILWYYAVVNWVKFSGLGINSLWTSNAK